MIGLLYICMFMYKHTSVCINVSVFCVDLRVSSIACKHNEFPSWTNKTELNWIEYKNKKLLGSKRRETKGVCSEIMKSQRVLYRTYIAETAQLMAVCMPDTKFTYPPLKLNGYWMFWIGSLVSVGYSERFLWICYEKRFLWYYCIFLLWYRQLSVLFRCH